MSKEIANLIVSMTNEDGCDAQSLKNIYKRKIKDDSLVLKRQLHYVIKKHMQNEYQPDKNRMTLNNMIISHSSGFYINSVKDLTDKNDEDFVFSYNDELFYITSDNTRKLIKTAIIPLDLKWTVKHGNGMQIEVSWDHWDKE